MITATLLQGWHWPGSCVKTKNRPSEQSMGAVEGYRKDIVPWVDNFHDQEEKWDGEVGHQTVGCAQVYEGSTKTSVRRAGSSVLMVWLWWRMGMDEEKEMTEGLENDVTVRRKLKKPEAWETTRKTRRTRSITQIQAYNSVYAMVADCSSRGQESSRACAYCKTEGCGTPATTLSVYTARVSVRQTAVYFRKGQSTPKNTVRVARQNG